jgi:hypothetical protein
MREVEHLRHHAGACQWIKTKAATTTNVRGLGLMEHLLARGVAK